MGTTLLDGSIYTVPSAWNDLPYLACVFSSLIHHEKPLQLYHHPSSLKASLILFSHPCEDSGSLPPGLSLYFDYASIIAFMLLNYILFVHFCVLEVRDYVEFLGGFHFTLLGLKDCSIANVSRKETEANSMSYILQRIKISECL